MTQYFTKVSPFIVCSETSDYQDPAFQPRLADFEVPIDEAQTVELFLEQTVTFDDAGTKTIDTSGFSTTTQLFIQNLAPLSEDPLRVEWVEQAYDYPNVVDCFGGGFVAVSADCGSVSLTVSNAPAAPFQVKVVILGN